MRIGIISDVHGNIKAMEAVLQQLEDKKVEKIICLGDLVGRSTEIGRCSTKDHTNER